MINIDVRERKQKGKSLRVNPELMRKVVHGGDKIPYKSVLLAFLLFALGMCLVIAAVNTSLRDSVKEALPYITLGGICFVPGAYYTFILLNAWMGTPGYSYSLVPSSD